MPGLIDPAGIRDTADPVEQEGVARARAKAASAELVLWLQDVVAPVPLAPDPALARVWRIGTKADLAPHSAADFDLVLSAQTGDGLSELAARLQAAVADTLEGGETALVTRARHRGALEEAGAALRRAEALGMNAELAVEEMRTAATALGRITGRIDVEEILGAIFSRFCIGK